MLREIERARETVRAVLPRGRGPARIDGIEQTLPEVAQDRQRGGERGEAGQRFPAWRDPGGPRNEEPRRSNWLPMPKKVIEGAAARPAGKPVKGPLAGVFTGVFKRSRPSSVVELRR